MEQWGFTKTPLEGYLDYIKEEEATPLLSVETDPVLEGGGIGGRAMRASRNRTSVVKPKPKKKLSLKTGSNESSSPEKDPENTEKDSEKDSEKDTQDSEKDREKEAEKDEMDALSLEKVQQDKEMDAEKDDMAMENTDRCTLKRKPEEEEIGGEVKRRREEASENVCEPKLTIQ
eukprot:Platyproteum_vivax@DN14890_c0_g1_i2.p1